MKECTCGDHVVQCAHWDGDVLVLVNDDDTMGGHTCGGGETPFDRQGYSIHLGRRGDCQRAPDCPAITIHNCRVCLEFGDDETKARAEFGVREAALVGADEEQLPRCN